MTIPTHPGRRWPWIAAAVAGAIVAALLLLVSLGWDLLRHPIERRLSARLNRTVTIGSIRRIDHGLLAPVLEIDDLIVAQPGWVGGGAMVKVRRATVELPLAPMLLGQARPRRIAIDGLRIALVRRDGAHANWKGLPHGSSGGSAPTIAVSDGLVTLADAKRDHHFAARVTADARGFLLAGTGSLAGHASTIWLAGAPLAGAGAWPFKLDYRSGIANATLFARADHPLDIGHFTARVAAWGDDARDLDRLIEAGLPGTQPVRLAGMVRRNRSHWHLTDVALNVGRSAMTVTLDIDKRDGRTKLAGTLRARAFDFADLASDAGLARAAAKRRTLGPRLIPDTRIALDHLQRLDGRLDFDIAHLLFAKPSAFRALTGTLAVDHGTVRLAPVVATLARGRVIGMATVSGEPARPTLALDLRLVGSRVEGVLARPDAATGALAGRIRLAGRGATVREAVGGSSGAVALVAHDGTLARRAALFLGADAGRALFEGKSEQTTLRCAILRLDTRNGVATPAPLIVDTAVGRTTGSGKIMLADERLALSIAGRPKLGGAARIETPIEVTGTIRKPKVVPPPAVSTVKTVVKAIRHLFDGKDDRPPVPPIDCDALSRAALR